MNDELQPKLNENSKNEEKEFKFPEEIDIPDELKPIVEDQELPDEKKDAIIKALLIQKASSFSGPIPPPEILKGYNEVLENGAERIIIMAEKQSEHRMQLENHAIKEQLKQSRRGQNFGFTMGIIGLALATILSLTGHETVAGIFGGTTIVGLTAVFVIGKRLQQKERSETE